MGHTKTKFVKCEVCGKELSSFGINNYLDYTNGRVWSLCDEHLAQATHADEEKVVKK